MSIEDTFAVTQCTELSEADIANSEKIAAVINAAVCSASRIVAEKRPFYRTYALSVTPLIVSGMLFVTSVIAIVPKDTFPKDTFPWLSPKMTS